MLAELRKEILTGDDGEFCYRSYIGEEIEDPRAVFDELGTVALFGGGRRLVVLNDADPFVTDNRATLEDYVANPKPTGVLVLEVKTWPASTKLYKAVAASGLSVDCSTPTEAKIKRWMLAWAKEQHQATFEPDAAERLLEIIGPQMGRLDQEIAKLALLAGGPRPPNLQPPASSLIHNHPRSHKQQCRWLASPRNLGHGWRPPSKERPKRHS